MSKTDIGLPFQLPEKKLFYGYNLAHDNLFNFKRETDTPNPSRVCYCTSTTTHEWLSQLLLTTAAAPVIYTQRHRWLKNGGGKKLQFPTDNYKFPT